MKMQQQRDCLDSLLFAAAKNAGTSDIDEYNKSDGFTELPSELSEKICDITKKKTPPKKGHLSFKRRFAIIAAAALLICGLTIGSIAGKKQEIAETSVSLVAEKYILSYDTTGIKTDGSTGKAPAKLTELYNYGGKTSDGGEIYEKDGVTVICTVSELTSSYSLVLGYEKTTDYFEILVNGKYNGCAATTEKDGKEISIVAWNDGKCAFELTSEMDVDELCALAE